MPPRCPLHAIPFAFLLVLTIPAAARAEGYLAGFAGAAFSADQDVTLMPQFGASIRGPLPISVAISTEDVELKDVNLTNTFLFGGKAGWFLDRDVLGGQFGLEAEVSRFRPELQPMSAEFSGAARVGRERVRFQTSVELEDQPLRVITLSGSLLYRHPFARSPSLPHGRLQLYAGPGLAGVFGHLESNTLFINEMKRVEDSDSALAIQGIGGVKVFLTKHIAIFSEYKVLRSGELEFHFEGTGSAGQASSGSVQLPQAAHEEQEERFHLTVHEVYGGVAIHF